jgi:hypothetical protein
MDDLQSVMIDHKCNGSEIGELVNSDCTSVS